MIASRALFLAAAALSAFISWTGSAGAATPGLVIDASSGKVLFAERATEPWYPASITKLMTTYVALDMVKRGQASMSTLLTMSPYAASQPPSKIGLKPGMTMTLENAIKIIMVKSANDIATMIGENLGGGSVEGFSDLMNESARRLGMHESRWTNPSGLPDFRQQTSARDMAILARALILEFPDQEHLFRIGAVKLGAQVMRNHNGLLGRYPGADGMKTGFICSGGFNVVASASQGGTRLITVVMGYGSAKERDLRAADLFDMGFTKGGWTSQNVADLPPSNVMSPPDMRPYVCGAKRHTPSEDDDAVVSSAASDNPLAALFSGSSLAANGSGAPIPGTRRDLGPRVAFAPIPVWTGPSSGRPGDEDLDRAASRLAAGKPIRTKRLTRTAQGQAPADARAFAPSGGTTEPLPMGALRSTTSEGRTRPGAIAAGSSSGRARLGAIPQKKLEAPPSIIEGANPDASASPARRTAAPAVATKTSAARKPDVKKPEAGNAEARKSGSKAAEAKKPGAGKDAAAKELGKPKTASARPKKPAGSAEAGTN